MPPAIDRRTVLRLSLFAAVASSIPLGAAKILAGPNTLENPAMTTDPRHDFDFFFGSWTVQHRRLKERLANSIEWVEFDGACSVQPLLGGSGNLDDNVLNLPGGAYRAVTLRSFEPETKTWAIWWLDSRHPHALETPVIGRFENGVGTFFADDTLRDKPIKVRFQWSHITSTSCRWEQAFSPDGGASWEVNWAMQFTRTA